MKLVVSGDKHLGLVSDGVSRLEEQRRVVDFVVDAVDGADVHVDLGDLFDTPRPSPEAYALAMHYFLGIARTDATNFALVGNHDRPTRAHWTALDPFQVMADYAIGDYGTTKVVREPVVDVFHGWQLVFLPFVTEWQAREAGFESAQAMLDGFVDGLSDRPTIAFAHLDVEGSRRNEFDSRQRDVGVHVPRALIERANRVYAGHVHRSQNVGGVVVVGSAIHVDFGESADEKGIVVLEVESR